jgi:hypothetical protein
MNDILEDGDLDEALVQLTPAMMLSNLKCKAQNLNHSLMEPLNNANIGL